MIRARTLHRRAPLAHSWLALTAALLTPPLRAQTPKTLAEIPLYPGAAAPQPAETEEGCESSHCRFYLARASIEDVLKFYQQRLAARDTSAERYQDAQDGLTPGAATPAFLLDLVMHQFSAALCPPIHPLCDKAAWTANRRPYAPDQWVSSVTFAWARRDAAGERSDFRVHLTDRLDLVSKTHLTGIAISTERTSAAELAASEQEEPEPQPEPEERPLAQPSAAELGAPLYPGARYFAARSVETRVEGRQYVYLTDDPPASVVRFYEAKLGKRATTLPDSSSKVIVLAGQYPDPDRAVYVMANPSPEVRGKTVILIRNRQARR